MRESKPKKKKIAILGTGVGSLSTAFELTDYPGWNDLYDITVYQMGWRAGGKTASSRGKNERVEERGIHILQGWYWNVFRLFRRTYDERKAKGIAPKAKFQNWYDAVQKDTTTLLTTENSKGEWESWPFVFPEDELIPGDAGPIGFKVMFRRLCGVIFQLMFGSPYKTRTGLLSFIPKLLFKWTFNDFPISQETPNQIPDPNYGIDPLENARLCSADMDQKLDDRTTMKLSPIWYLLICIVVWPVSWIYFILRFLLSPLLKVWTQGYRFFAAFEWILISVKGSLADCYSFKQKEIVFGVINDWDYRAWLKKHHGSQMMIQCGLVKFMYYGSFANLKDYDSDENAANKNNVTAGVLAADIAVRIVLDTIFYKGSLVWKTKAGTGGTIIAPVFMVLRERGVKFKFFNRVTEIMHGEDNLIQEIKMAEQVKLAEGVEAYDPIRWANGVPDWPTNPLLEQIDPEWAEKISAGNVNLESAWAKWTDYRNYSLKIGEDFDQIVLGIPVNALKDLCPTLIKAKPAWKNMVEKVPTIQTFGSQMWIKPNIQEMGFYGPDWGIRTTDEPNSVNYADLMYSWTDMTQILEEETWPEDNLPKDLAYFTGTMKDDPSPLPPFTDYEFPEKQLQRVKDFNKDWLSKYMGWIFPKATPEGNPNGFDLNLLVDQNNPTEPVSGEVKFENQWFSPNIDPTNRYTLAWPGTDKYRLKTNQSGYSNLFLTGDWTNFGLNVGHLEGTCVSGIRTAIAVLNTYTSDEE